MVQDTLRRPPVGQQIANHTIFTGDNLDILRGMDSESIDLIYLDPPFNSNRHYAAPIGSKAAGALFKDAWTLEDTDDAWLGLIADENPALHEIIKAAGLVGNKGDKAYLIYMAMRLLEMHRILKPTGSIYLHCDDVMNHSLKLVMDAIFGRKHFANDISWKRTTAHSDGRRFGRNADNILLYRNSDKFTWNQPFSPYSEAYEARFKHRDPDGRRWTDDNLTAKGLSGGGYEYVYKGAGSLWRVPLAKMKELDADNRLHFTSKGGIRLKRYLDEMKGVPVQAQWSDIDPVNSQAKEKTGYPTQKPLALLKRIIMASSNEGDIVLDPFCGCATACLAAEDLGRQWIGIDISPLAATLIEQRMKDELGLFGEVFHRKDIPVRSSQIVRSRNIKHELYGEQEGRCKGCRHDFGFRHMEVDHIVPKAQGGPDTDDNLQLLCGHCNRVKGDRPMEYLIARLIEDGIIDRPRGR